MPKPIAICIEDMDAQAKNKYLRCVALPGRQPGLRLDEAGGVLWQSDDGVSCELWVSADDRLILYRPDGAAPVTLRRAGRSLDAPCGKPVVLIDQDQVEVGSRRLRVHVHGQAPSVAAPSPLPVRQRPLDRLARTVATAAVIGAVAATGACTDVETPTIDVIENPPEIGPDPTPTMTVAPPTIEVIENPPEAPAVFFDVAAAIRGEWLAAQAYNVGGERVWVTGTLTIKENSYTFTHAREITGTSVQGELDFLLDNPDGQVVIAYEDGPEIYDDIANLAPGYTLATFVFRADSTDLGEFLVKVRDYESLYLYNPSSKDGLWRVTKQLGADSGQ